MRGSSCLLHFNQLDGEVQRGVRGDLGRFATRSVAEVVALQPVVVVVATRTAVPGEVADLVRAVAGGAGTLSEIGHALKTGKPVIGLRTIPNLEGVHYVETAKEAVGVALQLLSTIPG